MLELGIKDLVIVWIWEIKRKNMKFKGKKFLRVFCRILSIVVEIVGNMVEKRFKRNYGLNIRNK